MLTHILVIGFLAPIFILFFGFIFTPILATIYLMLLGESKAALIAGVPFCLLIYGGAYYFSLN